jgi:alpha-L-arabinofuranosidase
VKSREPDLVDEHYYRSQEEMEAHAHDYDKYSRTNHSKIFCGEWATRVGSPTPNMAGALGDAAWMTGMERNSDIVLMSSYAPLFVNVSDPGVRCSGAATSSATTRSPVTARRPIMRSKCSARTTATKCWPPARDVPTYTWQPRSRSPKRGGTAATAGPTSANFVFDATRDSNSGKIYLKVVNRLATPQVL